MSHSMVQPHLPVTEKLWPYAHRSRAKASRHLFSGVRKHLCINGGDFSPNFFNIKKIPRSALPLDCAATSLVLISQSVQYGPGQGFWIARRHQPAGDPGLDQIRQAAHVRGDNGNPTQKRLESATTVF
jgi:hypothetical protein